MSSALLDHIIDCVRFHRDAGSSAEVEARAVADVAGDHVAKLLLASSRWEVTPERVHALTTLLTTQDAPVAAEAERVVRAMLDVAVLAGISGGAPLA
jgi:hypothetical protein